MAEESAAELLADAKGFIRAGAWGKVVALVASLHPADLVDPSLDLEESERRELLDRLPTDIVGEMFAFAEDDELRELIRSVGIEDLPAVLEEVEDDVAADVIQQLEPEEREETLAALDRDEVADLLRFAEESAGGIMSRGFVALNEGITVQQSIDYLRVLRPPADRAYYLYIVDNEKRLQGTVSIRDLLVSAPRTTLGEITQRDIHAVNTHTDEEEAARTLQRYNLLAVPVVDEEGRLEGVMAADDLIDVLEEEATPEDMYRMVGLDEEESVAAPIRQSIRLRLPWLLVNVVTAFAGGLVVSLFDSTLEKAVVLAAFMPVVANQSGVTGTQTATILVRALALGDVRVRLWRMLVRELLIGFTNGLVVGILISAIGFVFTGNATLAAVLLVSMTMASTVATLAGQLVPLILRSFGADPALASSIFVTMTTDAMSFLFLLGTASLVIGRLD